MSILRGAKKRRYCDASFRLRSVEANAVQAIAIEE